MKHDNFSIIDDQGFELMVSFDFEKMQFEDPEGDTNYFYIELLSIEAIIKGKGIDLLPLMNEKQKSWALERVTDFLSSSPNVNRLNEGFDIFRETAKYFKL